MSVETFQPEEFHQILALNFLFVFKSHHGCPQTTSLSYMICWKNRKETNCHIDLFNLFRLKKPLLENLLLSSWKQLTAWCLPTVHHTSGSLFASGVQCFYSGEDWLFQSIFESQKGCLKLEIAEESQQDGINSVALIFFYFCKQQKTILRPNLLT